MKLKTVLLCAMLLAPAAHAEFVSGELLRAVLASDDQYVRREAKGYIIGVFDATRGGVHCAPMTVTADDLVSMTKKMLDEIGALRSHTADVLIGAMLKVAHPCAQPGVGV